ncbi:helix-turn-helix domain-containing protein [Nocardia rhamnosiphila]|uniref:helix-turn-helix domain-containing protein n=1 Tax=Nocardia rhamnosiphila TaxID=426716 RepID=UPI0004C37531|nr:helix-turn-helix transcriptional regulator [Nocardia rhamnosiphila]
MPSKADLSGTTLPRRQLGRALRDARHARGSTLEQVARETEFSRATLSRIELGQYERIKVREVEFLCRYFDLPDDRTEYLMAIAAQSNTKVWWQNYRHFMHEGFSSYLELEAYATDFRFFQPLVIPGLLQTADYAKAIYRAYAPDDPEQQIDSRVEMRMQRQRRLAQRRSRARMEYLLHENVLHTVVGSKRVMAAQCRAIADTSTHDNVTLRVLPFAAGLPTGDVVQPFIVLDFPDSEPAVVHSEGAIGSMTFEDSDDVTRFRALYETLRFAALDEVTSRDRIRRIARRYDQ